MNIYHKVKIWFQNIEEIKDIQLQVKIWFQNRRNKWKRQLAADLEAASLGSGARW